jgi:hypothetical protein
MDTEGVKQLVRTLDEMIRTSRGGIRQSWRGLDISN